mmetsp:Transcript_55801/g.172973  ORF Transcript_55801/g.172973 Transcript_55801/m.172973 type:complete len:239 (+) Transcript_55801:355-1071(+)
MLRFQRATVLPPCPERGLCDPALVLDRYELGVAVMVGEVALPNKVRLGFVRLLSASEDDVAGEQEHRGHCVVTDAAHDRGGLVDEVAEEGVVADDRREHRKVHLDLQRLRHHRQKLDGLLCELAVDGVLSASLHPEGEVAGDGVLAQVLAQGGELPRRGAANDVQLRQVRRQGAHNDRRGHEREDPDNRGEESLEGILWLDLVHAAGELGHGPVKRDQILGLKARAPVVQFLHPGCTA